MRSLSLISFKSFAPGCLIRFALIFLIISRGGESLAATSGSSISLGSSLSNNQTIQSANGLFQFGFFSVPSGSSSMYLGIWYASITPFTSVWVANREQAVTQAATCSLTPDGQAALIDKGKTVWEIGGSGLNVSALVLMDTGNLALKSSNSSIIWQSFDNPGNTWLPTMSLGHGKKLQSWLTPNDPSIGSYALIMGSSNNFVSVYNDSTQYWDSGAWNGHIFSNVPEMTSNFIYNFTFNSSGFTWYIYPNVGATYNISRFIMTSNGAVQQSSYNPSQKSWNEYWFEPTDTCDVVRLCGQNSICNQNLQPTCECPSSGFQPADQQEWTQLQVFSHGCERISPLNCTLTQGSNDGFIPINQTSFDWNFTASWVMSDQGKCRDLCLANCSCNGFYFNGDGSGNCSLFSEALFDGTVSSSALGTFYLRVSAKDLGSNQPASKKKTTSIGLIVGIVAGGIAILVMATLAVFLAVKRRKLAATKTPEAGLRAFSYAELQAATKNFKEKLGSGGFGTVYRGVVGGDGGGSNGAASLAVAVKKLHRLDEGEKQFRAEVRTIGTIQHVNLVRLLGFCSEGKHRLLVYEMADNGSLDGMLFRDDDRAAALTWQNRHNIALGVAHGIAYLHESCRECIIHCDIKPENILLDASYTVKVADFGLAKLVGREFSRVLTTLRGTRGYLAPEWIAGMPITAKADVYSFGMTMLELISGQRNIHNDTNISTVFFPVRAAQLIHQPHADLTCLLDSRLQGNVDMEELQRVAYCAIWCIQDNEDFRPSMGKVVQILEGSMPISPPPIPTSLQCLIET